ncbi:MAG: competence protein ComE, partial [Enterococcus faecium]|nr:competence protein ComE [Enterococcus faecium]
MLEKSSKPCDTNKEKITDKTQNKRIPWDQYFMAQAVLLSLRSTCTRL